jgi:hypothetical protein
MTPNIDRNQAPETWITAAPLDTLTIKNGYGQTVNEEGIATNKEATPTEIPVRFHLYWAGSDKDGSVAGFYYAVVETTELAIDGVYDPLPAPKPGEYSFTTKTDTTFVFTVSELSDLRRHAFFIFAVDNQGKQDLTPARFIFTCFDNYPPRPVFDLARATGWIVNLRPDGGLDSALQSFDITDTGTLPMDTVPAYSQLDFAWHGEITQPGTFVLGYRYKLDEDFQLADSSVRAVSYGTNLPDSPPVSPGLKTFFLRALDQANGVGKATRSFVMNFSPDTWWAGPDPDDFPLSTDGEYGSHFVDVIQWPIAAKDGNNPVFETSPPLPEGSTFGPDSFRYRPSRRFPPKWNTSLDRARPETWPRTFYEIYGNRLYARTEGDTVHMNSWVVLWNGGYDKDSRYAPKIDMMDDFVRVNGSPVTQEVIQQAGRVGSPVGFRSQISVCLTPSGAPSVPAQSTLYPFYQPTSVFQSSRLGGYWRMRSAGKAYALARAQDADGGLDNSVPVTEPVWRFTDRVDAHQSTASEDSLRRKVLVFYVNKAPALVRNGSPEFRPREGESISTCEWNFVLRGMDLDPFDPSDSPPAGGPTATTIIRYKVTLYGHSIVNPDSAISWTYLTVNEEQMTTPYVVAPGGGDVSLNFTPGGTPANNPFASGPIRVSIQICDCRDCEVMSGQGRCVDGIDGDGNVSNAENVITVMYTRPSCGSGLGTTSSTGAGPGPDPSGGRD